MNEYMVCDNCGHWVGYDGECTLYLKCPYCDNVLIDVEINEKHLDYLTIFDYGIEHLEDGEWMWTECRDSTGRTIKYWKKKDDVNV